MLVLLPFLPLLQCLRPALEHRLKTVDFLVDLVVGDELLVIPDGHARISWVSSRLAFFSRRGQKTLGEYVRALLGVGKVLMVRGDIFLEVRVRFERNPVLDVGEDSLDEAVDFADVGELWVEDAAHKRTSGGGVVNLRFASVGFG